MRNWIEIDGRRSMEFGLKMARLPLWPMAAETITNIDNTGQAVEPDRHTGQYKDFDLTLTGYLTKPPSQIDLARLQSWLSGGKQLVMSTQPELVGLIRKVGQIKPTRVGTRANEIQIPFSFQPFKLSRENYPHDFDCSASEETSFTILNRGNVFCEPKFILTFAAEPTTTEYIEVNGEKLIINPVAASDGDPITVDVQRKKVYTVDSGVATVVQRYTSGRFWALVLESGWNTVTVSAGITAVEVTKNERWL